MEANKLTHLDQIKPRAKLILCGAGALGIFAYELIKSERPDLIVRYFIDDNKNGFVKGVGILIKGEYLKVKQPDDLLIITSTYWQSFSRSLDASGFKDYLVFDLLSQKARNEVTEAIINNVEIKQYTPNLFLELCLKKIEDIEPGTLKWINTFNKKSVFYDIGASNGIYSLYAIMARNCNVLAVEADVQNFSLIQKNCYLNNIQPNSFIGINIALGSSSNLLKMHSEEFVIGMHSKTIDFGGREQNQKNASFSFNTLVENLDYLITRYKFPLPDYIKIDVDGAEFQVLQGCVDVLRQKSVELLVETDERNCDELDNFLLALNYKRSETHNIFEVVGSQVEGVKNYLYKKVVGK